jgi:hypothetical protein
MKTITTLLPILTSALLLTACGQTSLLPNSATAPALVQRAQAPTGNQLAIRFRSEANRTAIMQFNSRYGLQTLSYNAQLNVYLMTPVNPRINVNSLLRSMGQDPAVAFAEVNHTITVRPVVDMQISPILN